MKKIAAAIRGGQNNVAPPASATCHDVAWNRLKTYAKNVPSAYDAEGALLLPNLSSVSIANSRARCRNTHPAELDTVSVAQPTEACRADKIGSLRNSVAAFNKLICAQNRHLAISDLLPSAPVGDLSRLGDRPLDWSAFSATFLRSRDRAIQIAVHPDRKRPDRYGGKLGDDPPKRQPPGWS